MSWNIVSLYAKLSFSPLYFASSLYIFARLDNSLPRPTRASGAAGGVGFTAGPEGGVGSGVKDDAGCSVVGPDGPAAKEPGAGDPRIGPFNPKVVGEAMKVGLDSAGP